jgi:hypothetical protein
LKGRKLPQLSGIDSWFNKIRVLPNHHQIQLFDSRLQLWVMMQANSDGKVHAFELEKLDIGGEAAKRAGPRTQTSD